MDISTIIIPAAGCQRTAATLQRRIYVNIHKLEQCVPSFDQGPHFGWVQPIEEYIVVCVRLLLLFILIKPHHICDLGLTE